MAFHVASSTTLTVKPSPIASVASRLDAPPLTLLPRISAFFPVSADADWAPTINTPSATSAPASSAITPRRDANAPREAQTRLDPIAAAVDVMSFLLAFHPRVSADGFLGRPWPMDNGH